MAQENLSPFGNTSANEVYQIIGQLYVQLYTAGNQLSEVNNQLAMSIASKKQLEDLMNVQLTEKMPDATEEPDSSETQ